MPIYEYQCQSCNAETEKLQKISDEPLSVCPRCGEPQLRRKISAAAFRLKGGGWYETDFKKDGKKNLAGDAAAPASGASGDSAGAPAASPSPASATAGTTAGGSSSGGGAATAA